MRRAWSLSTGRLIGCAALNTVLQNFFQPEALEARFLPALIVVAVFAASAQLLRAVTRSGAVAGAVLAYILYVSAGLGGFVLLFSVFLLTWLSTRLGHAQKLILGLAESHSGRNAWQILANLSVAAACSVASALDSDGPLFLLAAVAALAEAAADTVSSEVGQAITDRAYLITTLEPVPAGTDGGVSLPGTLAGITAAVIVAGIAFSLGLIPLAYVPVAAVAGVIGTLADSLLGAWLERRDVIGNNTVNFTSTLVAAGVAMCWAALRG
jgi:uncharacterized protein (TIGR00297 family)